MGLKRRWLRGGNAGWSRIESRLQGPEPENRYPFVEVELQSRAEPNWISLVMSFFLWILQAYTVELEAELNQLKEENMQLRQSLVNYYELFSELNERFADNNWWGFMLFLFLKQAELEKKRKQQVILQRFCLCVFMEVSSFVSLFAYVNFCLIFWNWFDSILKNREWKFRLRPKRLKRNWEWWEGMLAVPCNKAKQR